MLAISREILQQKLYLSISIQLKYDSLTIQLKAIIHHPTIRFIAATTNNKAKTQKTNLVTQDLAQPRSLHRVRDAPESVNLRV